MKALDHRIHSAFMWFLERLPAGLGRRVRETTGGRFGLASQILVGLGGGVFLTLGASFLALGLMTILNTRQNEINEHYMPTLVAAFEVARSSSELVRASPRLVAADTPGDLEGVRQDVLREEEILNLRIGDVTRAGESIGLSVVPLAQSLVDGIDQIMQSVARRMEYRTRLDELGTEIQAVGQEIGLILAGELDDQEFFIDTGLRELDDFAAPVSQRTAQVELDHHRGLMGFHASQNIAITLMFQAMAQDDADLLRANQERVYTAFSEIQRALEDIRPAAAARLGPGVERLRELYDGTVSGVFTTRTLELEEIRQSQELLNRNQQTTAEMVAVVEDLVGHAENAANTAASGAGTLLRLGWWLILGVNVIAVGAAVVVGWKFFGERLLVRVRHLSDAMRRMSRGDLEVQVEIAGNDEVTDMAGALEVFRQHAVDVQRLNLVEKLANEVQAKNIELESTLDDLRRTQQQVVKQEKLASLGALTAGIAHEIRNPLNFVTNFAALSEELIEELREELEITNGEGSRNGSNGSVAGGGRDAAEAGLDREYIDEVLSDLCTNVLKVREHGERANRIVEGMLAHSREESGQREPVDVNLLLDEYAKLAYHGLRAADPTFNVGIERSFDPDAGRVEGIARDLSRVFLNVITNACQATDLRRREGGGDGAYSPRVWIATEDRDDSVCVTIRDNGTGIPGDILEKIFDPFFTTKAGTQGTGLGLSISHEIVQEHGGEFYVDSVEGEFTEFRMVLPRQIAEGATPPSPNPTGSSGRFGAVS